MRNLKKFLALVLAMMMAFSLMVTVNAKDITADFMDAESVTEEFQTAIDVTNGMGILKGYEDGTYKPKNNIRRSEVTALVYRLFTGDVKDEQNELQKHYVRFKDVSSDDWFAGYVGACQNAELIKGDGAGNFMPNRNVTGYEALAMILRAMGYDQNHEFEGTGWQVRVGAIATQRGILKNINNTNYSATLSMPATRELVAEMIFQAAQEYTVVYTPGLGYQTANVSTGVSKDSLGKTYFGLTEVTGIIVGNQDTGESKTFIATGTGENEYFYANTSAKIDAKTGIDMFGHKVNAWYCASSGAKGAALGKTFALYDNVVKTALVTPLAANGTMVADATNSRLSDSAAGEAPLGRAAQKAGFDVDLKTSKAVFNNSFNQSGTKTTKNAAGAVTNIQNDYNVSAVSTYAAGTSDAMLNAAPSATALGNTGAANSYPLYLLISNNSNHTVDMVVALNVSVSRITQVNAHASIPTVTVAQVGVATDNNNTGTPLPAAWNDKMNGMIAQKALTDTSIKTLGEPVVGVAIVGTTAYKPTSASIEAIGNKNAAALTTNLAYRLSKPTQTVEGTVTNFNYNSGAHDGSIVIGGKRIERSLLADAISQYDPASATNRGMTDPVNLSATANLYGNYRAYLDSEGKYIWIEPIYDTEFVYGTYIDYTTPYGSSTYEYTLVGVNLKGEQVKKVVKTIDGFTIAGGAATTTTKPMSYLGIPSRDNSTSVSGVTPGAYTGFLVDGEGNLTGGSAWATTNATSDFRISPTVTQVGKGDNTADVGGGADGILDNDESWSINTTDAKLGTKKLDSDDGAHITNKYFTNDTKFIVVDGAGTDTQKVKVYTGLTELLDGGTNVTIKGAALTANWVHSNTDANQQMYYTESPLTYASVQGNPMKVDTIILPKDAITWTGRSNLFYLGSSNYDSMITTAAGHNFYLYTMYENGEKVQKWLSNNIAGGPNDTVLNADTKLTADGFYVLADTGLKTPTGETVYTAHDDGTVTGGGAPAVPGTIGPTLAYGGIKQKLDGNSRPDSLAANCYPIRGGAANTAVYYNAATYGSQTATITEGATGTLTNAAIFNVANAKVVNVNATNTGNVVWPGVVDLGTLNDASSTATTYQTNLPKVAIQTDPTDPLTVTVIYVCYAQ